MVDSIFLSRIVIHSDWIPFLVKENLDLLKVIESEVVKDDFTPGADKVLRFLTVPLQNVKVIIIGQDPYPQPGIATGRAFEVGNLKSWTQPFKNVSLKNILRAIYKTYTGEVITYNMLKEKLYGDFPVLPPDQLFESWEKQGVLLLNTSFTCIAGNPGSHQKHWEVFSKLLLKFISCQKPDINWFIWGDHALNTTRDLKLQKCFISKHPMMCFNKPDREKDFLYGQTNCFKSLMHEINWTGFPFEGCRKTQYKLF